MVARKCDVSNEKNIFLWEGNSCLITSRTLAKIFSVENFHFFPRILSRAYCFLFKVARVDSVVTTDETRMDRSACKVKFETVRPGIKTRKWVRSGTGVRKGEDWGFLNEWLMRMTRFPLGKCSTPFPEGFLHVCWYNLYVMGSLFNCVILFNININNIIKLIESNINIDKCGYLIKSEKNTIDHNI